MFTVKGNSMWPLIRNGDVISLRETNELKNGDIITLRNPYNRVLTHRLLNEKNLITKGDNNVYPEKPLAGKSYELYGKLDYVVRNNRKLKINQHNDIFYKYSNYEMKFFGLTKKIIPFKHITFLIKRVMYGFFILFFTIVNGRNY